MMKVRTNRECDFLYLYFSRLNLQNSENAVVQLDNVWSICKIISHSYDSGGGFTIFYKKVSGRWEGKVIYCLIA
jgi:hypothetical protein